MQKVGNDAEIRLLLEELIYLGEALFSHWLLHCGQMPFSANVMENGHFKSVFLVRGCSLCFSELDETLWMILATSKSSSFSHPGVYLENLACPGLWLLAPRGTKHPNVSKHLSS